MYVYIYVYVHMYVRMYMYTRMYVYMNAHVLERVDYYIIADSAEWIKSSLSWAVAISIIRNNQLGSHCSTCGDSWFKNIIFNNTTCSPSSSCALCDMYAQVRTCKHMCAHVSTCVHMYTHVCTCMHMYAHVQHCDTFLLSRSDQRRGFLPHVPRNLDK